ncbi:MAG: helix-hairpin-helix domain-containing protein, partial [Acinetobacter sp.]
GRQENVLGLKVDGEDDAPLARIETEYNLEQIQPQSRQDYLKQTAKLFWLGKIRPQIEHSLLTDKRLAAEAEAMNVFAENLRHLLLSAPAGGRTTLGVDPGIRTGVKLAVVSDAGDVLAHSTIYPFAPKEDKAGSIAELARLCREFHVELIAIGNGTASRETEAVVAEMMAANSDLPLTRITVSEAGASVYSASELASQELPELDVSIRGAVSIARRLQDPLAELVKIDPKSIGVGQYQHDVNQTGLAKTLEAVVEDCVNSVGVDVNTASPAILAYIAGLNKSIAQQIFEYRKEHGRFDSRQALKKVPRLGERTFEQSAGFLRVQNGSEPLDASAVHPESYGVVEKIVAAKATTVKDIIGNSEIIRQVKADEFVDDKFGLPTIQDILAELEKPARDPRPEFRTAKFREDITEVAQLTEGMQLEGVVTNVTNFGAFVDVGVHQDGLVHISELANEFVADPHKVVKPGQIVQVRVLQVDAERKRVNLSMRAEGAAPAKAARPPQRPAQERVERTERKPSQGQRPPRKEGEVKRPQQNKPKSEKPQEQKIGGLGALLLQAGVKGSK